MVISHSVVQAHGDRSRDASASNPATPSSITVVASGTARIRKNCYQRKVMLLRIRIGAVVPSNDRKTGNPAGSNVVQGSLPRSAQSRRQKRINLKRTIEQMPELPRRGQIAKTATNELKPGLEQCMGVVHRLASLIRRRNRCHWAFAKSRQT